MELQKFIKEQLKIQENNPVEALEILDAKKEEMENAIEQIKLLESQTRRDCLPKWEEQIKEDFSKYKYEIVGNWRQHSDNPNVGLKLSIEGHEISILIEQDDAIFYGISRQYVNSNRKPAKIRKKLEQLFDRMEIEKDLDNSWYIYEYSSYQDVYGCFKTLVEEVIESIGRI
jgi:hypothetical protein